VDRAIAHKLNLTAANLMEAGEIIISPQDSIDHLQRLMTQSGWGQVPVVDPQSGAVVGIVTRTDLLKTMAGGAEKLPGRLNLGQRLDSALPFGRLALLKAVAAQARELHQAVYIVGGVVRDLVLERPSQDFDVVVEGDAIALGNALCQRFGGRIVAHGRFGTAKWWIAEQRGELAGMLEANEPLNPDDLPESLDLISARVEFYEYPTALPTVERSSIKLDLHRRDFTINTMAIRLDGRHYGDLYDYWGGLIDLRQGLVRVLHSLSFVDDPTRMLRAVRFEQRFGFQIEARTLQLMADAHPMVPQVSGERLRHELDLMLSEPDAVAMFNRLAELGLLRAIHPNLEWNPEIAERVNACLTHTPDPIWDLPEIVGHIPLARVLAYITWFGGLAPEQAQTVGELLRMPVALLRAIAAVHSLRPQLAGLVNARPSLIVEQLETYPRLALCILELEAEANAVRLMLWRFASQWRQIEPLTNGDDLRARGVKPGPAYRAILSALRQGWLDGEITSAEEERERLEGMISQ
jgi:tRNA nucleotidyltransferase (CCA-adding enzyme)